LKISQPEWFFNKEFVYDAKIMENYKALMFNIIKLMKVSNKNMSSDVKKILELEREFAMLQLDEETRRMGSYHNMTLAQLQTLVPDVCITFNIF
jgi:hypothetical protein